MRNELRKGWWDGLLEDEVSPVLRQIFRAVTLGIAQGVVKVWIKVKMILCRMQITSQWMLEKNLMMREAGEKAATNGPRWGCSEMAAIQVNQ